VVKVRSIIVNAGINARTIETANREQRELKLGNIERVNDQINMQFNETMIEGMNNMAVT
jgi:hypothetical protein